MSYPQLLMRIIGFFLIIVLGIPLLGCDSNNGQGILDSRDEFMTEFKKALSENNIPFTVDDKGYVRYSKNQGEAVERIKRQVDERLATEVGSKFQDELSTRYFRRLLDDRGVRYRAVNRKDGEWTYWNPESKQQQEEIEMKVVAHAFEQQKKSN